MAALTAVVKYNTLYNNCILRVYYTSVFAFFCFSYLCEFVVLRYYSILVGFYIQFIQFNLSTIDSARQEVLWLILL